MSRILLSQISAHRAAWNPRSGWSSVVIACMRRLGWHLFVLRVGFDACSCCPVVLPLASLRQKVPSMHSQREQHAVILSRAHSLTPTIETRARGLEDNSADLLSQQGRDLPQTLVTTRRCRAGRGAARVCLGGVRPCGCWRPGLPEGYFLGLFPGP